MKLKALNDTEWWNGPIGIELGGPSCLGEMDQYVLKPDIVNFYLLLDTILPHVSHVLTYFVHPLRIHILQTTQQIQSSVFDVLKSSSP